MKGDHPTAARKNLHSRLGALQSEEYGLGAVHDGIWYFAFGANMSRKKLTGSRGIAPLESLPAKLPGWALEFNHRCMNTLAPSSCQQTPRKDTVVPFEHNWPADTKEESAGERWATL